MDKLLLYKTNDIIGIHFTTMAEQLILEPKI